MYRVALRALRTTQRTSARTALRRPLVRSFTLSTLATRLLPALRHLGPTTAATEEEGQQQQRQQYPRHQDAGRRADANNVILLKSSSAMFLRRGTTYALLSTLVGFGAWYTYGPDSAQLNLLQPSQDAQTSAAMQRKVLVLGQNDLQTGTFVGDGPITKTTADGRRVVEMLNPDQATEMLRRGEESVYIHRGEGVVRYDVVQLPSNDPIEDDHAEQVMQVLGNNKELSDWMFWGVFDGHRGWTTSATLRQSLISAVSSALNETYLKAGPEGPSGSDIDATIKSAFTKLDDEIVHKSAERVFEKNSRVVAAEALAPGLAGSCALLSFYDARTKELRVACTGDSRAVLGRRGASGRWTATALSTDQTGSTPEEVQRLKDEHPGEPHAVFRGRVLGGLEPSRAFGDASYKWSLEVTKRLRKMFFGVRSPSPYLLTPPYVTAEPVVTTTKIRPDQGDFVVMATDGLWEMLTNEEVVGLVGKWLDSEAGAALHQAKGAKIPRSLSSLKSWLGLSKKPVLPVEPGQSKGQGGQKTPVRKLQWSYGMPDAKDDFVVKDKNVATHLIRNALGGGKEEQVCSLLTLPAPTSRLYRDDLTVQVIFFGRGEDTGEITLNFEATTPSKAADPTSKL